MGVSGLWPYGAAALLFCLTVSLFLPGTAIKCWECRSDADSHCADPFDNTTFHFTDCDQLALPHIKGRATMCRKIRQKVNGEWRYIRSCAWLSDPEKMAHRGDERYCLIRSGTWDIHIEYCECYSKDGCNSSPGLWDTKIWFTTTSIAAAILLTIHFLT